MLVVSNIVTARVDTDFSSFVVLLYVEYGRAAFGLQINNSGNIKLHVGSIVPYQDKTFVCVAHLQFQLKSLQH